jgi:hypothetical protein
MRRLLLALLAVTIALVVPTVAAAQTTTSSAVQEAADALQTDSVWVAEDNAAGVTQADADRLRREIRASGVPTYIAVFPAGSGEPLQLAQQLLRGLRTRGVYGVIAGPQGRSFEAGQAGDFGLDSGTAKQAATDAVDEARSDGGPAILDAFVAKLASAHDNGGSLSKGPGAWIWLVAIAALGGAVAFFAGLRRRRTRRMEAAQADELRKVADEDLVALGEDIRALDIDIDMPGVDPRAREDYARALQAHEQASDGMRLAKRPQDFARVAQTLEEGRYAMESAKARLAGQEPPEHRPPCFFDPRHGPSTRDVEWTPEFGAPRLVPACEADALRVEAGEDPQARQVELAGGGRVPYWQAPAYYGPYAGGFFGGWGGGGLLTGFLAGSLLSSAWSTPIAYGDPGSGGWGGGDFGGGADFGGGGDFGGDFGGGGDF